MFPFPHISVQQKIFESFLFLLGAMAMIDLSELGTGDFESENRVWS